MSVSRQTSREALAALLSTALVGSGKPAAAVYDYLVGDFQGQSPVVVVASGPIDRQRDSLGACYRTSFLLRCYVFVAYSDPAGTWTEADAEDAIDAIEVLIADTVLANSRSAGAWDSLTYETATELDSVTIGGVEYRREIITLRGEVY